MQVCLCVDQEPWACEGLPMSGQEVPWAHSKKLTTGPAGSLLGRDGGPRWGWCAPQVDNRPSLENSQNLPEQLCKLS